MLTNTGVGGRGAGGAGGASASPKVLKAFTNFLKI